MNDKKKVPADAHHPPAGTRGLLPYNPLRDFLARCFDGKVYKIAPPGHVLVPGDNGNSADFGPRLARAMDAIKAPLRRRYPRVRFMAILPGAVVAADRRRNGDLLDELLADPEIVGVSLRISTKDSADDELLDLAERLSTDLLVSFEYLLDSANPDTLRALGRPGDLQRFEDSASRAHGCGVHVVARLVLGLPGEDAAGVVRSATRLAGCEVDGVDLRTVALPPGSAYESAWRRGELQWLDPEDYVRRVVDFLEVTPQWVTVHRLVGPPSPLPENVDPWPDSKQDILRKIEEEFYRRGSWQGKRYRPSGR